MSSRDPESGAREERSELWSYELVPVTAERPAAIVLTRESNGDDGETVWRYEPDENGVFRRVEQVAPNARSPRRLAID